MRVVKFTYGVRIGLSEEKFQISICDRHVWNNYKEVGPVSMAVKGNVTDIYNAIKDNGYEIFPPVQKDWGFELEVIEYCLSLEGSFKRYLFGSAPLVMSVLSQVTIVTKNIGIQYTSMVVFQTKK